MLSFIVQHACNIIMIIVPACDYGNAEKISDPYKNTGTTLFIKSTAK